MENGTSLNNCASDGSFPMGGEKLTILSYKPTTYSHPTKRPIQSVGHPSSQSSQNVSVLSVPRQQMAPRPQHHQYSSPNKVVLQVQRDPKTGNLVMLNRQVVNPQQLSNGGNHGYHPGRHLHHQLQMKAQAPTHNNVPHTNAYQGQTYTRTYPSGSGGGGTYQPVMRQYIMPQGAQYHPHQQVISGQQVRPIMAVTNQPTIRSQHVQTIRGYPNHQAVKTERLSHFDYGESDEPVRSQYQTILPNRDHNQQQQTVILRPQAMHTSGGGGDGGGRPVVLTAQQAGHAFQANPVVLQINGSKNIKGSLVSLGNNHHHQQASNSGQQQQMYYATVPHPQQQQQQQQPSAFIRTANGCLRPVNGVVQAAQVNQHGQPTRMYTVRYVAPKTEDGKPAGHPYAVYSPIAPAPMNGSQHKHSQVQQHQQQQQHQHQQQQHQQQYQQQHHVSREQQHHAMKQDKMLLPKHPPHPPRTPPQQQSTVIPMAPSPRPQSPGSAAAAEMMRKRKLATQVPAGAPPKFSRIEPKVHVSPFAELCSRVQKSLEADREVVHKPDCRTPFESFPDAFRKLMKYHIFFEPDFKETQLKKADKQFEEVSTKLMERKQNLVSRLHKMKLVDSMNPLPKFQHDCDYVSLLQQSVREEREKLRDMKVELREAQEKAASQPPTPPPPPVIPSPPAPSSRVVEGGLEERSVLELFQPSSADLSD